MIRFFNFYFLRHKVLLTIPRDFLVNFLPTSMLILIKNILNVIGKGNKKKYQINNYDLGRRKLCNGLSAISRRKKNQNN